MSATLVFPPDNYSPYHSLYYIAIIFGTIFVFGPLFIMYLIPRGPNREVAIAVTMLSSFHMWLVWSLVLCAHIHLIQPPVFSNRTLTVISQKWGYINMTQNETSLRSSGRRPADYGRGNRIHADIRKGIRSQYVQFTLPTTTSTTMSRKLTFHHLHKRDTTCSLKIFGRQGLMFQYAYFQAKALYLEVFMSEYPPRNNKEMEKELRAPYVKFTINPKRIEWRRKMRKGKVQRTGKVDIVSRQGMWEQSNITWDSHKVTWSLRDHKPLTIEFGDSLKLNYFTTRAWDKNVAASVTGFVHPVFGNKTWPCFGHQSYKHKKIQVHDVDMKDKLEARRRQNIAGDQIRTTTYDPNSILVKPPETKELDLINQGSSDESEDISSTIIPDEKNDVGKDLGAQGVEFPAVVDQDDIVVKSSGILGKKKKKKPGKASNKVLKSDKHHKKVPFVNKERLVSSDEVSDENKHTLDVPIVDKDLKKAPGVRKNVDEVPNVDKHSDEVPEVEKGADVASHSYGPCTSLIPYIDKISDKIPYVKKESLSSEVGKDPDGNTDLDKNPDGDTAVDKDRVEKPYKNKDLDKDPDLQIGPHEAPVVYKSTDDVSHVDKNPDEVLDADREADKYADKDEDKDADKDAYKYAEKDADKDADKDAYKYAEKDEDKDADVIKNANKYANKDEDKDADKYVSKNANKDEDKDEKDDDKDVDKDEDKDAFKYAEKYADKDANKYVDKDADKYADIDVNKYANKNANRYADKDEDKDEEKDEDKDEEKDEDKDMDKDADDKVPDEKKDADDDLPNVDNDPDDNVPGMNRYLGVNPDVVKNPDDLPFVDKD